GAPPPGARRSGGGSHGARDRLHPPRHRPGHCRVPGLPLPAAAGLACPGVPAVRVLAGLDPGRTRNPAPDQRPGRRVHRPLTPAKATQGADAYVPNPTPASRADLHEVSTRNPHARRLVAGCSGAIPVLGQLWQPIDRCLSDVPVLIAEITCLRREISVRGLERANLAAAARATIAALAAGRDAEPDPLWYLRDELAAQGLLPEHDATTAHPARHDP